jgi:hypothetical protein
MEHEVAWEVRSHLAELYGFTHMFLEASLPIIANQNTSVNEGDVVHVIIHSLQLHGTTLNIRKQQQHSKPTTVKSTIVMHSYLFVSTKESPIGSSSTYSCKPKGKFILLSWKILQYVYNKTNRASAAPRVVCIYSVSLLLIPFPPASTNYAQHQIHMHIFTEKDKWVNSTPI